MPRLKSSQAKGDLFVRVKVRVPKDLTAEQEGVAATSRGGRAQGLTSRSGPRTDAHHYRRAGAFAQQPVGCLNGLDQERISMKTLRILVVISRLGYAILACQFGGELPNVQLPEHLCGNLRSAADLGQCAGQSAGRAGFVCGPLSAGQSGRRDHQGHGARRVRLWAPASCTMRTVTS